MIKERFLRYISYDTQSDPHSQTVPSTKKQLALARVLYQECLEFFDEVEMDSSGIVYARMHGTKLGPAIGLCAHMDTAQELSGAQIHPRCIEHYDGLDIVLNERYTMRMEDFPALQCCIGDDLIVTDGTTLLGGDDKAGIAIILEAIEQIKREGMPHGAISVAFTVDEEIGRGCDSFDLNKFPCDFAYTIDGGAIECVDWETFHAACATVTIRGTSVHPGEGKGRLVNAALLAMDFAKCLPPTQTPFHTEGRQGFFHLNEMQGDVEKATLVYLIRDHDLKKFEQKKMLLRQIVDALNDKYGLRFSVEINDQYANMADHIVDRRCIERAQAAIERCGLIPVSIPVRGGTDGALLSAMGCPCPNLGTGTFYHHGRYEFASLTKMKQMVEILKEILK